MTVISDEELRDHCHLMIDFMVKGYLIPFFGAGVNLSSRLPGANFARGLNLPDADELSEDIARQFNYKWEERNNLPRVSWHASYTVGPGRLYQHLHEIFSAEYTPTEVHRFFAQLPGKLAKKGYFNRHQLIVTTNYDELLERAFDDEDEPYDLLTYVAHSHTNDEREVGKFRFTPHRGESQILYKPNEIGPPLNSTVILKIHGAVDKTNWKRSSFVVTEDDYIHYLARMNTGTYQIPAVLMEKMLDGSFLFLGYSLGDWNLRVLIHSIRANRPFDDTSWAIMNKTKVWDEAYWKDNKVQLMKLSLIDYVKTLNEELEALPNLRKEVIP